MSDEEWSGRDPDDEFVISMLCDFQPRNADQLAEWLMICATGVQDKDGRLLAYRIPPHAAFQMARMMQIARLEVPRD